MTIEIERDRDFVSPWDNLAPQRSTAPLPPVMPPPRPAPIRREFKLAFGIILACGLYYCLSVLLSSILDGQGLRGFHYYFYEPTPDALAALGDGGRLPLMQGRIWTLLTSNYLHADISHIGFNMLGVLILAPIVERHYGLARGFALYTIAGIVGALASAAWGEIYSLGASGSIFGLLAAQIVASWKQGSAVGRRFVVFGTLWAALNLYLGISSDAEISNASHIGGLVGGGFGAMFFYSGALASLRPARLNRLMFSLVGLCLVIGAGVGALRGWQFTYDKPAYSAYLDQKRQNELTALAQRQPRDAETFIQRGWLRQTQGKYDEAIDDFNAAIALKPSPDAYVGRASVHYAKKDYAGAIVDLTAALDLDPDNIDALRARSAAYAEESKFGNAADDLTRLLERVPSAAVYGSRADVYYRDGKYAASKEDMDKAIELDPGNDSWRLARGQVLDRLGNSADALADFDAALKIDPSAWNYGARCGHYSQTKQFQLALIDCRKGVELDPKQVGPHLNLAGVYIDMKDYKSAIAELDTTVPLDEENDKTFNSRAWALYLDGRSAEGLPDAEKALRLNPTSAASLDTRAHIFEVLGQRDKAIADYRAALAIDPSIVESQEGLQRLGAKP